MKNEISGRLQSCVESEIELSSKLENKPIDYIKRFYFDAITYEVNSLKCCMELVGQDRLMFGTDHPFFPPPKNNTNKNDESFDIDFEPWPSTVKNQTMVSKLNDENVESKILAENAVNFIINQQSAAKVL